MSSARIRMALRKLVAGENVADKPGDYENFTGTIDYKSNYGEVYAKVKNATFTLEEGGFISWEDGTWIDGTWFDGQWAGGVWKNGKWESGDFIKGEWQNGQWDYGQWFGGRWIKGKWEGGEIYDNGDYVESDVSPKEYFNE